MSSIPSSAMPHAYVSPEFEQSAQDRWLKRAAEWKEWALDRTAPLRDRAREDPRVAIAAAAAALGLVAAIAFPLFRKRRLA